MCSEVTQQLELLGLQDIQKPPPHRTWAMAHLEQDGGNSTNPRASTDSQTHLLTPSGPSPPWAPSSSSRRLDTDADADIDIDFDTDTDTDMATHMTTEEGQGQDSEATPYSADEARRTLARIDARIMPLLFATSMFNFTDKAILSSAAVFGLREDNALTGAQQYAWVSSVFYVGFLVASYPAARLAARLPVARLLGTDALLWGAVVALTATCHGFGGLLASRLLLGAAEAAVSPCLVLVTATWYTRDEIPARTGVWFAGNSAGGIFSSLLAYGIGHAAAGPKPEPGPGPGPNGGGAWRWMFAVLGVLTVALGGVLLRLLPNSISDAGFLTPRERRWARDRVVVAGLGSTELKKGKGKEGRWRWEQTRECLADPKTWILCALALLCQIPNGGTQSFANIVVTSFGFSPLQSALVNIPYSLLCIVAVAGSGWVAGRFRSMNCILVALVVVPPIVGSALISHRSAMPRSVSLVGYFLLATGPSALPLLLSLVQSNFRGVTKKMTMTALLFVAYCAGNIAGPQLFVDDEAPTYDTAFRGILVCYSLVVGLSLALRAYLGAVNLRRQRAEGVEGSAGASGAVGGGNVIDVPPGCSAGEVVGDLRLRPEDYEDVTDWHAFGFRYRL
ncbi:MFS general substrate transporter [Nemania sp. NC0429]|nr:MFS general substrate transporter [Nemania sp. NC0429]